MLEVSRSEAEDIRQRALRQASELARDERAGLAAAEGAAFERAMTAGRKAVEDLAADHAAALTALRQRVEARMSEAVQAIVEVVTEDGRA